RPARERAEEGGVAQHGRDRRSGDGPARPGAARLADGHGALRHAPPRGRVVQGPGLPGHRRRAVGDGSARALLQRPLRGSDVLGHARADRALLQAAGAALGACAGRSCAGAVRAEGEGDGMIEAWRRVLVLAPHTDDGEFGCGGTMARLVEGGAEVRYVAFSIATKSLPDGFPPDTLAREVREATAELGIPESSLTVHD